jgi:hypothetical protein
VLRGERVHATRSLQTWPGQVVSVVKTFAHSGAMTGGVPSTMVDALDCNGSLVSFFVPVGTLVELAE